MLLFLIRRVTGGERVSDFGRPRGLRTSGLLFFSPAGSLTCSYLSPVSVLRSVNVTSPERPSLAIV